MHYQETWIDRKWRPMMAVQYTAVCVADFIIFPILFTLVQFWEPSHAHEVFRQWSPITLQNGGLYHIAMGAILGITAWSRGQEKLAGVAGPSRGIYSGANGTSASDLPATSGQQNYSGRLAPPGEQPLK